MNRVVALVIDRRTEEVVGVGIENDIGSRSFCSMDAIRKFEVAISNGRIVENEVLLDSYEGVEYVYLNTNPTAIQNRDIVSARNLLSKKKITVYHGTKELNLVPMYGKGKRGNDYGVGFYTTPILNLAREWSCSSYSRGGACYVYELYGDYYSMTKQTQNE